MPKDLNMAKTTAGPTDKTYPDTVIMSIRTALRFDLAATLCIIPLLRLLRKDTTIFEYNNPTAATGKANANKKYKMTES